MPISVKTDLEWGQIFYIKTDPYQEPGILVGIVYLPGKQMKFILKFGEKKRVVYDFEASPNPDHLGLFVEGDPKKEDEEDDDENEGDVLK